MFGVNFAWNPTREEFSDLEAHLQRVLYRREPRPEFVRDLRSKLLANFRALAEQPMLHPRRLVILAAISFISTTLVVLLVIRLVSFLITMLTVLQKKRNALG